MKNLYILIISLPALSLVSTHEQKFRKVLEPNILFFKGRSIQVKAGVYHVIVSTNLNPEKDFSKLEQFGVQITKVCETIKLDYDLKR